MRTYKTHLRADNPRYSACKCQTIYLAKVTDNPEEVTCGACLKEMDNA